MIKQQIKLKICRVFLSLIFILPFIQAVTILPYGSINSTEISSQGLNLTVNCTNQIYAGVIISDNSIYFENKNLNNDPTNSISFNMTEINKSYFCTDLPQLVSNDGNTQTITSGLGGGSSGTVSSTVSNCTNFNRLTYFNGTYTNVTYNCTNNQIISSFIISNGTSYLTQGSGNFLINYTYTYNYNEQTDYSEGTSFISNGVIGMVVNFFSLSPVIGTIFAVAILISVIVLLVVYIRKLKGEDEDTIRG